MKKASHLSRNVNWAPMRMKNFVGNFVTCSDGCHRGWGGRTFSPLLKKSIFFYNFDSKEIIHFESSYLPKLRVNEPKEAIFGQ